MNRPTARFNRSGEQRRIPAFFHGPGTLDVSILLRPCPPPYRLFGARHPILKALVPEEPAAGNLMRQDHSQLSEPTMAEPRIERYRQLPRADQRRAQPTDKPNTVLLVDDDRNVLGALGTAIADGGYEVVTAANGKDALEKAQNQPPDVVVSDVTMPVMDGPALVDAMAADHRLSEIPVVLNSAHETPPPVRASAFLKKPYSPRQLLDLIRHLIDERHRRIAAAIRRR